MATGLTNNEETRRACLEVLATRPGAALNVAGIKRRIVAAQTLDFRVSEEEIAAALAFLSSQGLVSSRHDPFGSTVYWEATGDGILHYERGN